MFLKIALFHRKGEISRREAERGPKVIPIPNPESTKKKVPVRLHEKIKETRDPVVGLDFIREYIAVSDPEMEPHYECDLCGNQASHAKYAANVILYKANKCINTENDDMVALRS
jgi:hypothetical protein